MGMDSNNKKRLVSDINVTPFVDVVLVLLVIFMISAPLMLNGIKLDLPKTREVNKMNITASQVILSFTNTNEIFIGKEKFLQDEIIPRIMTEFKDKKTNVLYVRADYGLKYGSVAKLISFLKRGGITNLALVTEIENQD